MPRFRLRTLMIAVAGVGIVLAMTTEARRLGRIARGYRAREMAAAIEGSRLGRRLQSQAAFQEVITAQLDQAERVGTQGSNSEMLARIKQSESEVLNELEFLRHRLDHVAALRRKYNRAARYPWLPISPDPPPPERTKHTRSGGDAPSEFGDARR